MKTLLTTCILALNAMSLSAQEYNYLVFQNQDNSTKCLSIDGLKITFQDDQAVATVGGQTETFPLTDLKKLYFSEQEITGIEQVVTTDDNISIEITGGKLKVHAPEGSHIAVFQTDGRRVSGEYLPQGIYIVRVNNHSFKVAVQ